MVWNGDGGKVNMYVFVYVYVCVFSRGAIFKVSITSMQYFFCLRALKNFYDFFFLFMKRKKNRWCSFSKYL